MSKKQKLAKQKPDKQPDKQQPNEEGEFLKAFVYSSRIYSAAIIVITIIKGLTKWLSEDISTLLIILLAIFIFLDSFKLYLRGKKIRPLFYMLIMLLLLGAAFYFSKPH